MKRLITPCLALTALVAVFGSAEEIKRTPALPTPIEAADGWLALFDGESLQGWKWLEGSNWEVNNGVLQNKNGSPGILVTTSPFMNYDLLIEYQTEQGGSLNISFNSVNLKNPNLLPKPIPLDKSLSWVSKTLKVQGESNKLAIPIGLDGNQCAIRCIKLRPLGSLSLFNGKDLSGWKEHPGKKSTFCVTPQGYLHIINGPGDLQSEGKWKDFLLQFDCRTNGKNLNSGAFFRCLPGQYQQGYEAQIHNGFTREAEKEYTLEIYDPKTNELTEKKKIKSSATDYGTGAIYRRIPARRQVANDQEWFTMTVLAHQNHIATWVNGVQVVDWTDNRPIKANARQGAYLEAGPISFQGHDPTTDIDFRAIRIIDLKSPKETE